MRKMTRAVTAKQDDEVTTGVEEYKEAARVTLVAREKYEAIFGHLKLRSIELHVLNVLTMAVTVTAAVVMLMVAMSAMSDERLVTDDADGGIDCVEW